jgi:hypothetical protein
MLSAEAEYHIAVNGVVEDCWLRQLLQELHSPLRQNMLVYCGNINVVYLSTILVQHQSTKHIEINLHFIHEMVAIDEVHVFYVPTTS